MRNITEADMKIQEISPESKYLEKLFARNPLIGNAIVSDSIMEKIYHQAKQIVDKLAENPSIQNSVPIQWHLFVVLATVNYAKKWNVSEESRFTKYITLQFGYRDDTGRIWHIISNSIERAFKTKGRFFFRDEGEREFYETVLIHSFSPVDSWNPVFDLLYDFLKNNLRWNYVKEDPIVDKMVNALAAKLNGQSPDEEDLIISSVEYRVRLGAKRLIQNRPEYTAILFDDILERIESLINNRNKPPKHYVDYLVDDWFSKKISRMIESDKRQISRSTQKTGDTALSYSRIRSSVYMKDEKLCVHVPAIRLEGTGHKSAEIRVYESDRLVGRVKPEIYGNELGETLAECDMPISLSAESKCNIRMEVICDSEKIYDSGRQLYRKLYIFKNKKECSINSLKTGIYEMYIPDIRCFSFRHSDVIKQAGKYIEICLQNDFAIMQDDKILGMDTTNMSETTIAEPLSKEGVFYISNNERYEISDIEESFKIYINSGSNGKYIRMYVNDNDINTDAYWIENEAGSMYEIPLSEIVKADSLSTVTILDLTENRILYKKTIFVIRKIDIHFNRPFYLQPEDYTNALLTICFDGETAEYPINEADSYIEIDFADGQLIVDIPAIRYEWKDILKMYPGESLWKDDIQESSRLHVNSVHNTNVFVEIGDHKYVEDEINLYEIVKGSEKAAYNSPVVIHVNDERYKIGQIVYSEMFTKMPLFSYEEGYLLWDGGINYIGNRGERLLLQLFTNEDKLYDFPLIIGKNKIVLSDDFKDGEYTYSIVKESEETIILAQDVQFFGNPNKIRFENKTILINEVTEDTGEGSKPLRIKPVYIERIEYVAREYVPSEDGTFDVYTGQMYFVRMDGTKKYYSNKYYSRKKNKFYKVNPVKIIYINDGLLRIVNEDDEGLYWYDNIATFPRLEITDREPPVGVNNYKDILFYLYGAKKKTGDSSRVTKHASDISGVGSTYARTIFDKFIICPQTEVVEADVNKRILVNAGPGTGKTWTLIERIIHLVDASGIDPEAILILCFSKAAVEVIKNRLSIAVGKERVSEIVNQVDIRTFDSFASQVLYWVKNESNYDDLQFYEIRKLNYDARISLFNSVISSHPDIISQCEHLIVDEVQDLVRDRARMVIELIKRIPETSGATLLGDSCQSIYDYQAGSDNMTSLQFYKVMVERTEGFSYFSFDRNYRQGEMLSIMGDGYRKRILSGNASKCDEYWQKRVGTKIEKFEIYDAMKLDELALKQWLEKGTVGILTRTNGQALKIAASLREKGVDHVLRKRLSDNSLNRWIAILFNEYEMTSIDEAAFLDIYGQINDDSDDNDANEVWEALRDVVHNSLGRIGVRDILRGIITSGKNPLLYTSEVERKLTVTNIHRGKGREFDTVLVEDDIFSEEQKDIEEHKVCYVAITRPRSEIFRINAKSEYMRIDKEGDRRCYKSDFVAYNKQRLTFFEVGLENDTDLRSFCRLQGIQEYIRENYRNMQGKCVKLIKVNQTESYVRYSIVLDETGLTLGYTSQDFCESLNRALRTVYHLPSKVGLYFSVYPDRFTEIYIDDVISVVDQADGSEEGTKSYGEMTAWNAISIMGYSKVEYI